MKFLIDNNLLPQLSFLLKESGFECIHVKEIKLQTATDEQIFLKAFREERIIISSDTDFSFILSLWKKNLPSVILFRHFSAFPEKQIVRLLSSIKLFKNDLLNGSLLIIEPERTRIKSLPF